MKPNKKLLRFLKQFFIQSPNHQHPDDDLLLSTQEFYRLLDKERFRSDRLGNPFSLVIIPLPLDYQTPEKLRRFIIKVHANTRMIDELGWFAPGTLGLYLFNTPLEGAQDLINRVKNDFDTPELLTDAQIMVYPDTQLRTPSAEVPQEELKDENRRLQERIDLNLVATIQPASDATHKSAPIQVRTRDISASGAYLLTDIPLPANTQLELEVLLPYEELTAMQGKDITLKAVGHVVRSDSGGVAVKFEHNQNLEGVDALPA